MKNIIKITTTLSFLLIVSFEATAQVDKFAKIGSRVTFSSENESWIKISVPFNLLTNPRLESANGKRPTTIESAFNPEYINDVKKNITSSLSDFLTGHGNIFFAENLMLDISSSDIRENVYKSEFKEITLDNEVLDYIKLNSLYKN